MLAHRLLGVFIKTLNKLAEPLLEAAHAGVTSRCHQYALTIHDWSRINYRKHASKKDRYQITHKTDVGYDLQNSLLIDDQKGQPIAPVAQRLVTGNGYIFQYRRCYRHTPRTNLN